MSANTYKLQLVIDDSKLKEIFGKMNSTFGVGAKSGSSAGGKNLFGNLAHLAKIAIGIGSAVTVLHKILDHALKASPIAQSSFKILEYAVNLILRPIGDIMGLIIRPFAIMMLRWAVPFYKKFLSSESTGKLLKGDIAGFIIDKLFEVPAGSPFDTLVRNINTWASSIKFPELDLSSILSPLKELKVSLPDLSKSFDSMIAFKDKVLAVFPNITEIVGKTISPAMKILGNSFNWLNRMWEKVIVPAWGTLTSMFDTVKASIDDIIMPLWTGITGGFDWVKQQWDLYVVKPWMDLTKFFTDIGNDITNLISKKWKDFVDAVQKIIDFFISIPKMIDNALKSGGKAVTDSASNAFGGVAKQAQDAWNGAVGWVEQVARGDFEGLSKGAR